MRDNVLIFIGIDGTLIPADCARDIKLIVSDSDGALIALNVGN